MLKTMKIRHKTYLFKKFTAHQPVDVPFSSDIYTQPRQFSRRHVYCYYIILYCNILYQHDICTPIHNTQTVQGKEYYYFWLAV